MTTAIRLLQHAAAQLRQEGKKPSLALFKAKLTGQLNAPELFTAYQQWRQQPIAEEDPALVADLAFSRHINAEQDMSSQLNRIEQKLDLLISLLENNNVSR